jgi:hypothetical protein
MILSNWGHVKKDNLFEDFSLSCTKDIATIEKKNVIGAQ